MNQVVKFTPSSKVDIDLVQKLFKRFHLNYGVLWKNNFDGLDANDALNFWFEQLKDFSKDSFVEAVKESLVVHKDYPPKINNIIDLCLKHSGIPTIENLHQLIVDKNFNHPLVKIIYDKIGSWNVSHCKAEEIKQYLKSYYAESLVDFREHSESHWEKLNCFLEEKDATKLIANISTKDDIKNYKEMIEKSTKQSIDSNIEHPIWDKAQISKGNKNFDQTLFDKRRFYLVNLSEKNCNGLSSSDMYDRCRYLREIEAKAHLSKLGYVHGSCKEKKDKIRPFAETKNGYKHWMSM